MNVVIFNPAGHITLIYFNFFFVIFQERLTVGRKPSAVADMIPEGEIILTINVYYPATYEKVSILFSQCAKRIFFINRIYDLCVRK